VPADGAQEALTGFDGQTNSVVAITTLPRAIGTRGV
jgi:hypothetical protein